MTKLRRDIWIHGLDITTSDLDFDLLIAIGMLIASAYQISSESNQPPYRWSYDVIWIFSRWPSNLLPAWGLVMAALV